jgi:hypothetical protein
MWLKAKMILNPGVLDRGDSDIDSNWRIPDDTPEKEEGLENSFV